MILGQYSTYKAMLLLFRRIFQLKNRTLCLKCCKKNFFKSKIWFQYLHFDVWIRHFHSLSDISSDTYEGRKSDNHPQFNWEQDREGEEVTKNTVREVVQVVYCYCKYSLPFLYKSISLVYFTVQLNNQNQCVFVDKFETLSHSEILIYKHHFIIIN